MTKVADVTFQNNILSLSGELDFSNVMSVYQKSMQHFDHCDEYTIDFSNLKDSNSSGLALIIEWIKFAKHSNKPIHFKSISPELMSIAKASGLDKLLLFNPQK
jgi:phospholipid transport system transporter-binding protein